MFKKIAQRDRKTGLGWLGSRNTILLHPNTYKIAVKSKNFNLIGVLEDEESEYENNSESRDDFKQ
jgi:hypothetical protein